VTRPDTAAPAPMDFVLEYLLARNPEFSTIDDDLDLIENRIVDSLSFVNFLFVLEEATGRSISLDEVSPEDFRTLRRVRKLLLGDECPSGAAHTQAPGGLAVLGPDELAVRGELDRIFTRWAAEAGAAAMSYQPLLPVAQLRTLDYWDNFPHLALVATAPRESAYAGLGGAVEHEIDPALLAPAQYALPSAACYAAYLHLSGSTVGPAHKITTVANCFRREAHYEGLRRLLSFTMREIVCIGERAAALSHIDSFKQRIAEFAERLELPLAVEVATDPFFEPNASRTLAAKLFPVKQEFIHRGTEPGLAIASVNFHRNFFAERCGIRTDDGQFAFTSCVAFGLERWLAALTAQFGPRYPEILDRIRSAEPQ
jgi:acyl carrier protein